MKTLALALAAAAFTVAPDQTTFDANKTSMLSGFQIVCSKGEGFHTTMTPNSIELCPGVRLIAPEGHNIRIQYNLFF